MYYPNATLIKFIRFLTIFIATCTILSIITIIVSWWKIFTKAGDKGWKALIPFYNGHVFTKSVAKKSPIFYWLTVLSFSFWIFLFVKFFSFRYYYAPINSFIPIFLGFLYAIFIFGWPTFYTIVVFSASRNFKKSTAFFFGLIFLPFIFYPILAFGKSKFSPSTSFSENKNEDKYEYLSVNEEEEKKIKN